MIILELISFFSSKLVNISNSKMLFKKKLFLFHFQKNITYFLEYHIFDIFYVYMHDNKVVNCGPGPQQVGMILNFMPRYSFIYHHTQTFLISLHKRIKLETF